MQKSTTDTNLLNAALNAFKEETGILIKLTKGNMEVDAFLNIEGIDTKIVAKIKKEVKKANLNVMINQVPKNGVLIAEYIDAEMAKALKDAETQFIDAAGNAYIKYQNTFVQITGNKRSKYDDRNNEGGNRAFEPTGLKVIFALLRSPSLVNSPYREIAKISGVANGAVTWVIKGLIETGFLQNKGVKGGRKLLNIPKLIDRWVEAYPIKLQNKLLYGVFETDDQQLWKHVHPEAHQGVWGGEVAADRYTKFLIPEVITLYLPEGNEKSFIIKNRLRATKLGKADQGKGLVRIYHPFWDDLHSGLNDELKGCAPPLLVYAELLATGDSRNIETAGIIYDKYLTNSN